MEEYMSIQQPTVPALLTRLEVSKKLRCSLTTLDRLKIPKVKIRRRTFYRPETISIWIAASEQLIKEAEL